MKTIKKIVPAEKINMGGIILDQPLPFAGVDYIDPFLLIHHWDKPLAGGQKQRDVGVGPHPHKGFSPVTFIYKGAVEHRDSLGNRAIVTAGGTQWMHAGKGITHSERPSKEMAEIGGDHELIQFWVNSPAKHKQEIPYYKPISKEETPTITTNGITIAVVAGEFEKTKGVVPTYSPMTLLRATMDKGASRKITLPTVFNTVLYLLDGSLVVNGQTATGKDMVWFNNDGEVIQIEATAETRFIVLSGAPINEEVTTYGPFVMNNQTEIMHAMRDAQMGKMGVLIEEF